MEKASARSVWQHTRVLLRPVRTLYLVAGAAVTLSTLITLAGPALVRYAVDAGIRRHETFPSSRGGATALIGVCVLLVAGTMVTAVVTS